MTVLTGAAELELVVIGTDTGVGKTMVVKKLCAGLRHIGRSVWLHKPVASGGWDGSTAEDARTLDALRQKDQPQSTICPWQFPEPASPHLAAAQVGVTLSIASLAATVTALRGPHDLLIEGIGGLLVPLTPDRATLCDLVVAMGLPVLIVCRPHLGTLNHTALTVEHARRSGVRILGLVLNEHERVTQTLATKSAFAELSAVTGLPVLAHLRHAADETDAHALAQAVLSQTLVA